MSLLFIHHLCHLDPLNKCQGGRLRGWLTSSEWVTSSTSLRVSSAVDVLWRAFTWATDMSTRCPATDFIPRFPLPTFQACSFKFLWTNEHKFNFRSSLSSAPWENFSSPLFCQEHSWLGLQCWWVNRWNTDGKLYTGRIWQKPPLSVTKRDNQISCDRMESSQHHYIRMPSAKSRNVVNPQRQIIWFLKKHLKGMKEID